MRGTASPDLGQVESCEVSSECHQPTLWLFLGVAQSSVRENTSHTHKRPRVELDYEQHVSTRDKGAEANGERAQAQLSASQHPAFAT